MEVGARAAHPGTVTALVIDKSNSTGIKWRYRSGTVSPSQAIPFLSRVAARWPLAAGSEAEQAQNAKSRAPAFVEPWGGKSTLSRPDA